MSCAASAMIGSLTYKDTAIGTLLTGMKQKMNLG